MPVYYYVWCCVHGVVHQDVPCLALFRGESNLIKFRGESKFPSQQEAQEETACVECQTEYVVERIRMCPGALHYTLCSAVDKGCLLLCLLL
jgi:hypothetical protein